MGFAFSCAFEATSKNGALFCTSPDSEGLSCSVWGEAEGGAFA